MSATRSRGETPTTETIFKALSELCTSPGYIHALCRIAVMDNFVDVTSGASAEQWMTHHRPNRLTRSEQNMLAGLLLKHPINYEQPSLETMTRYVDRTRDLLHELHKSLISPGYPHQHSIGRDMREPIFYSDESAHPFQYRDFAAMRYRQDEQWIRKNMGLSIGEAIVVADAIQRHQEEAVSGVVSTLRATDMISDTSVFYQALTFSLEDILATVDVGDRTVRAILRSFSNSADERNAGYRSAGDFNIVKEKPIIRHGDGRFVLFDHINLMESLYVTPYYWMTNSSYEQVASRHRGEFSEQIVYRRMRHVFGRQYVFRNVQLKDDAGHVCGEIDVLVVYGNRVIVGEVKSKRLTYSARKGSDTAIVSDFKKGIQAAYEQCSKAAHMIMNDDCTYEDHKSRIPMPRDDLKMYLFCVTSGDYPALRHQTEHLLEKLYTDDTVMPPFVCDVFTLDTITEMLDSPLRFFSYIDRRLLFDSRLFVDHELTILGYHLSQNLWIDDSIAGVHLVPDCAAALDAAMHVRRLNLPGERVPKGTLTPFVDTLLGDMIGELETNPSKAGIDLGVFLLTLPPDICNELGQKISGTVSRTMMTLAPHGGSYWVEKLRVGMTVYCGYNRVVTRRILAETVAKRMSNHRATCWFGVLLDPDSTRPYFVGECGSWEQALEDVKRTADKE